MEAGGLNENVSEIYMSEGAIPWDFLVGCAA